MIIIVIISLYSSFSALINSLYPNPNVLLRLFFFNSDSLPSRKQLCGAELPAGLNHSTFKSPDSVSYYSCLASTYCRTLFHVQC